MLNGRTIHVETLSYRGYWLASHKSSWARFAGAAEKDVYTLLWTKFKVSFYVGVRNYNFHLGFILL